MLPFLYIQSTAFPTMNLTQSFPPADALLSHLKSIDYKKWFNIYMNFVEQICLIIAAFVVVCAQQWRKHQVTEKLQISAAFVIAGFAIAAAFVKETVAPFVMQILQNVWRICYTIAQPPLTA